MNNSIDQQFIEFIVKSLVNNPDDISVTRTIDEKGVLLELTVNPEDLGRVIGKRGATAQSLRTLLRALGTKNDARYNLKIVDNGEPRPDRREQSEGNEPTDKNNSDYSNNQDNSKSSVVAEDDTPEEKADHSDAVNKTRAELADLDDLDI